MSALKSLQSNDLMMTVAASRSQRIEVVFGLSSPKHRGCGILGSHCNANASRRSIVVTFRPADRSVSDSNEQRRRCPSERWDLADRRTIITFHLSSPLALSFPLVLCSFAFALVCLSVGQQVDREGERDRPKNSPPLGLLVMRSLPSPLLSPPLLSSLVSFLARPLFTALHCTARWPRGPFSLPGR